LIANARKFTRNQALTLPNPLMKRKKMKKQNKVERIFSALGKLGAEVDFFIVKEKDEDFKYKVLDDLITSINEFREKLIKELAESKIKIMTEIINKVEK